MKAVIDCVGSLLSLV